jgi:hypothetical protein
MWFVVSECPLPPTADATSTKDVHVPSSNDFDFIAKEQEAHNASLAVLTDCIEIRLFCKLLCRFLLPLGWANKQRLRIALRRWIVDHYEHPAPWQRKPQTGTGGNLQFNWC